MLASLLMSALLCVSGVAASVQHLSISLNPNTDIEVTDKKTYITNVDVYLTVADSSAGASEMQAISVDAAKSSFTKGNKKYAITGLLAVGESGSNDNLLLASAPHLTSSGLSFSTANPDIPTLNVYYASPYTFVVSDVFEDFNVGIFILDSPMMEAVQDQAVAQAAASVRHLNAKIAAGSAIEVTDASTYLSEVDVYVTVGADNLVASVDTTKSTFTKGGKKFAITGVSEANTEGANDNMLLPTSPFLTANGITFSTNHPDIPTLNIYWAKPWTYVVTDVFEDFNVGIFILDAPTVEILPAEVKTSGSGTVTAPKLLGCYKDKRASRGAKIHNREYAARAMEHVVVNEKMTVPMCAEIAAKIGAPYFGLQYRTECWTSHNLTASERYGLAAAGACKSHCAGGAGICGGHFAISLYKA